MLKNRSHWQHFQHEADIGIVGFGCSPEDAFAQAAMAMTAVITDLETVKSTECFTIKCGGNDLEYLFVDWLNALVYEMAVRKMLFNKFDIKIQDNQLTARVCGERIDRKKHQPAVEVKGATLTELQVRQISDGQWMAQCIVDV